MNKKKYIPMKKVKDRILNLEVFLMKKNINLDIYPLNENYTKIYDFLNLKSSIMNWNYFSESITTNINKVCNLLKVIKNNGTNQELQESVDLINTNIIPYLKNPTEFKYNFNKLHESMPDMIDQILDKIYEQAECDRVIYNKDLVTKRFNIKKTFSHILDENNIEYTIYNFCDLIDTYDMPLKSKYCIANEIALLFVDDYFENAPIKLIEENIIDYFMIHYGTNDIPKFLNTIEDAINKDSFISEHATEYLKYLEKVYNNIDGTDYEKEVLKNLKENIGISFILNYPDADKYVKSALPYKNILTEMKLFDKTQDKVKELLTKIKISPVKTIDMAKETLQSSFESVPAEYVGKAVKTVLKVAFFLLITLSAFTLGLIAVILAFISKIIYDRYFSQESQILKAIEAMKEHQEEIDRKIHSEVVLSKKERMEEYSQSLEHEINKLQAEYEELKRTKELSVNNPSVSESTIIYSSSKRNILNTINQIINR